MIDVIVPLAGNDLISADGSIKCLQDFNGQPLTKAVLDSRTWSRDVNKYYFVLQNNLKSQALFQDYLLSWYPNSSAIFLDANTQGAALSVLSAIACVGDPKMPIIIDLADIYYESNRDILDLIANNPNFGAAAITFQSENPAYSYLKFDKHNNFVEAKEKTVISSIASAGTYIFKNAATYLEGISWYFLDGEKYRYKGLYYVCPLLNGVHANGRLVTKIECDFLEDIKVIKGIF